MNKKLALKVLFQNPLAVLIEGIRNREQQYFRKRVVAEFDIDRLPTVDILDLVPNLDETIESYSFLSGTSFITDLILLKSMAKKFPDCEYLEIGSWRGESLVNLNAVTEKCTSLTLSAAEMKSFGLSDDFIKVHGIFSDHIKSITKIEHNSHTYDFNQLAKKFDLVFIDGDHSYEGILNDTTKVLPLLKNKSSIIVWHDYSFNTEDVRYSTLKAILDGIPKNKHKNLYHVSNTLCSIYIEDLNHTTYRTQFPSYPNKKFSLQVTAERL